MQTSNVFGHRLTFPFTRLFVNSLHQLNSLLLVSSSLVVPSSVHSFIHSANTCQMVTKIVNKTQSLPACAYRLAD